MSFLNPLLLIAGLGIGLPILAHLLNRFQVQHTEWAAMQFLNRSVRVRSRQIKLRDLLLLILRCLALLLLVFALARPAWSGKTASWIPGEKRAGVVIALDGSFSMQHGERGDLTFPPRLEPGRRHHAEKSTPAIRSAWSCSAGRIRCCPQHGLRSGAVRCDRCETLKPTPAALDWDNVPKRLKELAEDMEAPAEGGLHRSPTCRHGTGRTAPPKFREALADLGAERRGFHGAGAR